MNLLSPIKLPHVHLALVVKCALLLSIAFFSEYGLGLMPCHLCWLQRYPYMVIIALSALALGSKPKAQWWLLALVTLMLLGESGLAFYHAGVEQGWFPSPGCAGELDMQGGIDALRESIRSAPAVRCDKPAIVIFSLSMAAWNALIAFGLFLFACLYAYRYRSLK